MNSGVLWVRNSPTVDRYFQEIFRSKDTMLAGNVLDQVVAHEIGDSVNLTRCSLPANRFASRCHHRLQHDSLSPMKQLITYHTACVAGTSAKLSLMSSVLQKFLSQPELPLSSVTES